MGNWDYLAHGLRDLGKGPSDLEFGQWYSSQQTADLVLAFSFDNLGFVPRVGGPPQVQNDGSSKTGGCDEGRY
jgi:hypothetical protein